MSDIQIELWIFESADSQTGDMAAGQRDVQGEAIDQPAHHSPQACTPFKLSSKEESTFSPVVEGMLLRSCFQGLQFVLGPLLTNGISWVVKSLRDWQKQIQGPNGVLLSLAVNVVEPQMQVDESLGGFGFTPRNEILNGRAAQVRQSGLKVLPRWAK